MLRVIDRFAHQASRVLIPIVVYVLAVLRTRQDRES
jgi:hypothetical protein